MTALSTIQFSTFVHTSPSILTESGNYKESHSSLWRSRHSWKWVFFKILFFKRLNWALLNPFREHKNTWECPLLMKIVALFNYTSYNKPKTSSFSALDAPNTIQLLQYIRRHDLQARLKYDSPKGVLCLPKNSKSARIQVMHSDPSMMAQQINAKSNSKILHIVTCFGVAWNLTVLLYSVRLVSILKYCTMS